MNVAEFTGQVFGIKSVEEFNALALQAFEYQREHCAVYRQYLELTGRLHLTPKNPFEIPFLPIRLFKTQDVVTPLSTSAPSAAGVPIFRTPGTPITFTSSATTGMVPSHHIVQDISIYEQSFRSAFHHFYGEDFNLLALLPSYLEREGSSLVYMADSLIKEAQQKGNTGGFFLYNHSELLSTLKSLSGKTILLGVSFALLDFAAFIKEQIPNKEERKAIFKDVIIMETGGMKGRGKELSRNELHSTLSDAFATSAIHSEYGMCELLSQAYSFPLNNISETGIFFTPPWMQVVLRDLQDPFKILSFEQKRTTHNSESAKTLSGGINIIDLANIGSCCFIETEDRGTLYPSATTATHSIHSPFTVDGRIKNSELRGCNMLIEV